MGDGSLSQEEIDALLQGADDLGAAVEPQVAPAPPGLSDGEKSELHDFAEEVAQSMGITLSTVTAKTVDIKNPQLEVLDAGTLSSQLEGRLVQITADYIEGITGKHSFVISEDAAKQIAALMMAQEEGELTEMSLSALTEGFSQMSAASLNTIEDKIGNPVKTAGMNGEIREGPENVEAPEGSFVRIRFDFTADGKSSVIDELLELNAAQSIAQAMLSKKGVGVQQMEPQQGVQVESPFQAGIPQQATQQAPAVGPTAPQTSIGVQSVQFAPLAQGMQGEVTGNIGLLMDVSMQLTVELGRTKMLIKDILGMGEGTIVELDKLAGEPVDLLVNGKLVAKGEVVVIDENFGVRVTDIISPMERISNIE